MRFQNRISTALFVVAALACAARAQTAGGILRATGVKGGLIVHLGCGDGTLTAALRANDRYLVHGLDTDAENVRRARRLIQSKGAYGQVAVDQFDGRSLPYADDLVNLVVAENVGRVPMAEIMRVLAPNGVAYVKDGPRWTTRRKPWPEAIDEWTHYLHDASNNAVARDARVGPPARLRWTCGPLWTRSHEFTSSLCAMVSAKGRLFYVFDEGLTGVTPPSLPERWTLIARDAFNGVLLWKRPVAKWRSDRWKSRALRSAPATVPRRIVAEGDRLFVTLAQGEPVSVLDAATGEVLTTYEGTEGTQELRCLGGVLLLRKGANAIVAIDTNAGRKLWEAAGRIQPLSLAAQGHKAFYQAGQSVFCVELGSGRQLWRSAVKAPASLLVVHGDRVVVVGRAGLQGLSAETGKVLWAAKGRIGGRGELFIANGRAWHWQGREIVGLDLNTGEPAGPLKTDDVFTRGHHLRCYQGKATERYLITPNRGVEFVSLTGGRNSQHDWLRGPCRYGIMPCNGLLYAGPHPCFCYPGVKLTGFNALSAKRAAPLAEAPNRLERGPAYRKLDNPQPAIRPSTALRAGNPQSADWPTYRHDARRTGATACEVPTRLAARWNVPLRGRLTPPVVAGNRLYVAARDEHTLYALGIDDGRELWRFTAGGRIDSPPTVHRGLVLFGCADGRVYCLRASDGELAWRFRAAPTEHRIVAFSQLESPWRVHGSILVTEGLAYCTAGRSTYLDGGIRLFALDPRTGRAVHETCLDTWAPTREDAKNKPFIPGYHMEGARSDILVSQGGYIYLGQYKLDRTLAEQEAPYVMPPADDKTVGMDLSNQPFVVPDEDPKADYETHQRNWLERTQKSLVAELRQKYGGWSLGQRRMGLHLLTTWGFLDTSWFNRTFWMYAQTWPGYYLAHRGAKTGQLLVVGPEKTYGVQAYPSRNLQSPLFTPGGKGYLLFADRNDSEPVLDHRTQGTTKGWGFTRKEPPVWHDWVPVRMRAMVLAGKHLFVAGPPDVVEPDDPMGAFEGRKGAVLRAHLAADGKMLAEQKLDAPPVFDGLIAAAGRLFMCTTSGRVVCFGKAR